MEADLTQVVIFRFSVRSFIGIPEGMSSTMGKEVASRSIRLMRHGICPQVASC